MLLMMTNKLTLLVPGLTWEHSASWGGGSSHLQEGSLSRRPEQRGVWLVALCHLPALLCTPVHAADVSRTPTCAGTALGPGVQRPQAESLRSWH